MRASLQIQVGQTVHLTPLAAPQTIGAAQALECAGSRMRLQTLTSLAVGTLVQLEWDDTLALGQVLGVQEDVVDVEIEHVITEVGVLERRNRVWWDVTGMRGDRAGAKVPTP